MSKPQVTTIQVQGSTITVQSKEHGDFISLTDMVRNFDGGSALILHSAHRRHDISSITDRASTGLAAAIGTQRDPQQAENLLLQLG